MASLSFEIEKNVFREYYTTNSSLLSRATDTFISIIKSMLAGDSGVEFYQITGRVKEKEECIKKFSRKYQAGLEENNHEYEIKDYITDLIGLRIVVFYQPDIFVVNDILSNEFHVIDITNKIEAIESSEDAFGYKGLHLDLSLKDPRSEMIEYAGYTSLRFEVQIRTIIQDAWSVLDHKIKYKKSIPKDLKRRINTLAALFELSDREFFNIREKTLELKAEEKEKVNKQEVDEKQKPLNVFSFLGVVENYFEDYQFAPYKVDGFVQEILSFGSISVGEFEKIISDGFPVLKEYQNHISSIQSVRYALNPFTIIRHIVYLGDKNKYKLVLYSQQRGNFDEWLDSRKV